MIRQVFSNGYGSQNFAIVLLSVDRHPQDSPDPFNYQLIGKDSSGENHYFSFVDQPKKTITNSLEELEELRDFLTEVISVERSKND